MTIEELNPFVEQINEVLIKYGFKKFNDFQFQDAFKHFWDYYYAEGETRPMVEISTQRSLIFDKNGFTSGDKEEVYISFTGLILNFLPTGKNVANCKTHSYKLNIEKFDWVNFEKWLVFQRKTVDTYMLLKKEDFITQQKKNLNKDFK
jgi:hypothetical protein